MEAEGGRETTPVKLEVGSTKRGPLASTGGSVRMVSCKSAAALTKQVLLGRSGTMMKGIDGKAETKGDCKEATSTGGKVNNQ
jgi:hypothetical protein